MNYKKAYDKASAICARQEQCVSMIRDKLVKWNVDSDDVSKIIERLIHERFIDEKRFCTFYVRDKVKFNKWGRTKIRWQLSRKGISANLINEALDSLPDEEFSDNLLSLLIQKKRQLKNDDYYKRKASLIRFAASRGFGFDEISKALDKVGID